MHIHLPVHIARVQPVQIDNRDALEFIRYWDSDQTTHFVDPPYVLCTRAKGSRDEYRHECDDDHHAKLIRLLLTLNGAVVLSGYDSPLYQPLIDAGWELLKFNTSCSAAGRVRGSKLRGTGSATKHARRVECVWRNPLAVSLAPAPPVVRRRSKRPVTSRAA